MPSAPPAASQTRSDPFQNPKAQCCLNAAMLHKMPLQWNCAGRPT